MAAVPACSGLPGAERGTVAADSLVQSLRGDEQQYKSKFCEENVYRLIALLCDTGGGFNDDLRSAVTIACGGVPHQVFAVFLTNRLKQCPIWSQRASRSPEVPVVWDYHVVVVVVTPTSPARSARVLVLDMDSTLPLPCEFSCYIEQAFKPGAVRTEYEQMLRLVPGASFLDHFASDRRHMLDSKGRWLAEPPPWPLLRGPLAHNEHTLPEYLDVDNTAPCCGLPFVSCSAALSPEFLAEVLTPRV